MTLAMRGTREKESDCQLPSGPEPPSITELPAEEPGGGAFNTRDPTWLSPPRG